MEKPAHPPTSMVGLDAGITLFATLSNGSMFESVNALRASAAKLAKYQRRISRKVKFSSNWKKAKACITKLHQRVAHTRNDFLHKTSNAISKNNAMVVIEDLKVTNMSKSASGRCTTDNEDLSTIMQKAVLSTSPLPPPIPNGAVANIRLVLAAPVATPGVLGN